MRQQTFFRSGFGRRVALVYDVGKRTWAKIIEHEIVTRAAAAAYYGLLALVPFLALLVTLAAQLAPKISGPSGTQAAIGTMTVDEFRDALHGFLPNAAYEVVAAEIAWVQEKPPVGMISIGLAVSLWLSSSLFGALMDALNRIYRVPETRSYLNRTLAAIGLTFLQAVILLGTLVLIVVGPHLPAWLAWGGPPGIGARVGRWAIATLGVLFSFDVTFCVGPNVRRPWKWVTPGSALGTVVLLASGVLLRVYVECIANYGRTYGALAGVMLLAFWFWIAALILLISALVNKIIEEHVVVS
jgi:membrane protein